MSQSERVIVEQPPPGRHDPENGTCFAIMHPLHGESFIRYFPDAATFRRLRDNHFTSTYIAFEVATLDPATNQWIANQQDTLYSGLWRREKRFLSPVVKHL